MTSKGFSVLPTHVPPPSTSPNAATGARRVGAGAGAGDTGHIANLAMPSRFSMACPCRGMLSGSSDTCEMGNLKYILGIFIGSAILAMGFFALSYLASGRYVPPPAPPASTPLLTFIVLGDWGINTLDQVAVAKQMEIAALKYNATLLLTTGDNFYEQGVENDTDTKWQTVYRDVYNTTKLLSMPWYITLGNHDHYAKTRGQAQVDYYTNQRDKRWYLPKLWYTSTLQVANEAGNQSTIQFIMFDSSIFIANDGNDTLTQQEKREQNTWMDTTFVNAKADWLFAVAHHPVISFHQPVPGMSDLIPKLHLSKADAFIAGHDHDLQHSSSDDVQYFVSGAGAKRETAGTATPVGGRWSAQVNGFSIHQVWADVMTTRFIDYEGVERYSYTQKRRDRK